MVHIHTIFGEVTVPVSQWSPRSTLHRLVGSGLLNSTILSIDLRHDPSAFLRSSVRHPAQRQLMRLALADHICQAE